MKVTVLFWSDRSPAGGRTLQVGDLSVELRGRGHDILEVDVRKWRDLRRALLTDVDVVHSHGGLSTVAALLFLRRPGHYRPPHLTTLHGWHRSPSARLENAAERVGLIFGDAVTVPTHTMLDHLPTCVRRRAMVIPNGVRAPVPVKRVSHSQTTQILWLGRVCREKGIDIAVDAFVKARSTHQALRLEVVGPLEDALARRLADHPPEAVRFHGYVGDPWTVFSPNIMLHTSRYDAGPRSVIEALGAGVPIVGTRVGGIPDIVRDGVDGLLAADGDTVTLASHLVTLAADPKRAASMSRAARKAFDDRYCLSVMGERIAATYDLISK